MKKTVFYHLAFTLKFISRRLSIGGLDATSYLLKSPNNAARLLNGVEDYKNGLRVERSVIEE